MYIMYIKVRRLNYTYNCTYISSFFILCIVFNVVNMQTEFWRSCPHRTKELAGLLCGQNALSFFCKASIPALYSTQLLNEWVRGAFRD